MAKPKPETPADAGPVDLIAIEPIRHDGVDIAPGKTFSASPAAAAALQAAGAARLVKAR